MEPLLHSFEFAYPDGYLFLDRTGVLCHRLRALFRGLEIKNLERTQVDLRNPADGLDLYSGAFRSSIQTVAPSTVDFAVAAAGFLGLIADALELTHLQEFKFRHVLRRACTSLDEANALMWPFVPPETRDRLQSVAPAGEWRAVQGEYAHGPLAFLDRIEILHLLPSPRSPSPENPISETVPHIVFHSEVRGTASMPVAELDVQAFIRNISRRHTEEVLSKVAPQLS